MLAALAAHWQHISNTLATRGIESVVPVGRHDDLDVDGLVEAVHLVEQLQQDALHLTVCSVLRVKSERVCVCVCVCACLHAAPHGLHLAACQICVAAPPVSRKGCVCVCVCVRAKLI